LFSIIKYQMFCQPCLPGPQGHVGFQGCIGAQGLIGSQGFIGAQGSQGPQGFFGTEYNNTVFIVNDDYLVHEWINGTLILVDSSNKEITITLSNIDTNLMANTNPITIRLLYKRGMNVIVQGIADPTNTTVITPYDSEKTFLYHNGAWNIVEDYENNSFYPTIQQGNKLIGSGNIGLSAQGFSVALSADGNTLAVGSPNDNSGTGATWIWTRNAATWTTQSKLVGTGSVGPSNQGFSVSLRADGNQLAIGGPLDSNGTGATWIFSRTGSTWNQMGNKIVGTGFSGALVFQGCSVSLNADGTTLAVGGYADNTAIGATWIFTRTGNLWNQQGNKIVGTNFIGYPYQGFSVSLSADGDTLAIGGPVDGNFTGATWIYQKTNEIWTQQGPKLVGTGFSGSAYQGFSVALSADGDTLAVGGPGDNSLTGATWIFNRNGTDWIQQGNKLIFQESIGTPYQGYSVSLSSDGNTLAVGGPYDSNATGATWTSVRKDTVWIQKNKLLGNDNVGSFQGNSVSLSADGNTLAIGGPGISNPFSFSFSAVGIAWIFV